MKKIRFALIGTGWRADFFTRIVKENEDIFEITSILCRGKEKGEKIAEETGIKVVDNLDDLIAGKPEFTVVCVSKPYAASYIYKLAEKNMPVLCETPPAVDEDELFKLYEFCKKTGAKVQMAEQYAFQPLYATWIKAIKDNMIGEVTNMNISALHLYHAVSMIRTLLGTGFENVTISGKRYSFDVKQTDSRDNEVKDGQIVPFNRDRLTFEFESGKTAFFDFSLVQYHTFIRTRHLNVQGTCGEIDDTTIRFVNNDGDSVTDDLHRTDLGVYNNNHWSHKSISLCGKVMYENPFAYARLNDDEIAIGTCLLKMSEYVRTGKEFYSINDGIHDGYIALMMEKVLTENRSMTVKDMPWQN